MRSLAVSLPWLVLPLDPFGTATLPQPLFELAQLGRELLQSHTQRLRQLFDCGRSQRHGPAP